MTSAAWPSRLSNCAYSYRLRTAPRIRRLPRNKESLLSASIARVSRSVNSASEILIAIYDPAAYREPSTPRPYHPHRWMRASSYDAGQQNPDIALSRPDRDGQRFAVGRERQARLRHRTGRQEIQGQIRYLLRPSCNRIQPLQNCALTCPASVVDQTAIRDHAALPLVSPRTRTHVPSGDRSFRSRFSGQRIHSPDGNLRSSVANLRSQFALPKPRSQRSKIFLNHNPPSTYSHPPHRAIPRFSGPP